jgi:peptidyl-prolyl cis-trans isomerase B (cyclophilin B)
MADRMSAYRRALVAVLIGAVVAGAAGGGWLLVRATHPSHRTALGTPSVAAAPGPAGATGPSGGAPDASCRYSATADDSGDRSAPAPPTHPATTGVVRLDLRTNHGVLSLDLDADHAPCAVNSFLNLVRAGYFTETPCHRLTTEGIYLLQCGDPTGTGAGGPGYRFDDENLPVGHEPAYPRGTIAMANDGPGGNGSQFFLIYRDSFIDPSYPVIGRVVQGIEVLDGIAAAGADDTNGAGDGPPNQEVTVQSVTPQAN